MPVSKDRSREGHEITYARDGIGYCRLCDDWHDLDTLHPEGHGDRRPHRGHSAPPPRQQPAPDIG